jgi:anti-sigma regulatory factor (Ser/Thr protein kinase)
MATPFQLRLQVTSDPAHLAPVRHRLEEFCAACGFDEKACGEIGLVVNEAMANVTRHAYGSAGDGPIELSVEFVDAVLRINIRDWGTGRLPPDRKVGHDPLQPGGVGLICLREWMDKVTFSQQPDGMLLTLERRLRARS